MEQIYKIDNYTKLIKAYQFNYKFLYYYYVNDEYKLLGKCLGKGIINSQLLCNDYYNNEVYIFEKGPPINNDKLEFIYCIKD